MEDEMNYVEETMEPEEEIEEVETEESGMGTGVAMLIGAGLAFASTAIVKLGKKVYDTYKAKKEAKETEEVEAEETEETDK